MSIKVGIIEDEKEICQSMQILINGHKGYECNHIFFTAQEAIDNIPKFALDVVLTDIHLPDKTGIDCVIALKPLCPGTQFVMCTSFEDTDSVFNALKAGAMGYLTKTIQPAKLLDAINEVYKGGSPMSSHIARKVIASFQQIEKNSELEKLTEREQEILDYLSKGLRYKEIADKIFLSTETVRTHIRNIYKKLQVNSRIDAVNKIFKR